MNMSCLFSKTQNHLCREPDCHGTGGTSHSDLWSLGRPHSLNHLEDFYPEHQQWRKGMISPRVSGPWDAGSKQFLSSRAPFSSGSQKMGCRPRRPRQVPWPPSSSLPGCGLISVPMQWQGHNFLHRSTGCEVRGHGQVRYSGEEAGSAFQTQEYGAMRSKEKPRAWWSSYHHLRGTEGNVSRK